MTCLPKPQPAAPVEHLDAQTPHRNPQMVFFVQLQITVVEIIFVASPYVFTLNLREGDFSHRWLA